jgi:NADH-quinone oxidoreductase subunit L
MLGLLWLVPALPAAGFIVLVLVGRRLGRTAVAVTGAGAVGLSAVVAAAVCLDFMVSPPAGDAYRQVLWTWFEVGGLAPRVALYLDALSVVFVLVITGVGFLIHLYSTEHMEDDAAFRRFFVYMNLFVAAMLVLVLADNLLLLYVGWEGVGLCSYLLISFWQRDAGNVYAGRKAFVVTRVGDTALIVGLFLIVAELHTLDIQPLMDGAAAQWAAGSGVAAAAAALLLGGAVGKSAQLPLHTWLPDAMAGPSPVSALIHAATMVTAGVYLIARTNVLFELAPDVRLAVAVVGTATLLYAGLSALAQRDIKRVLAYSTISQIGYMFLALGVSGWSAAVFHFTTHAFFKALLFLGAGVVIEALGGEHDIFRMGGLRRRLPLVFWTFLAGAGALAALPLVTAGFYSKDLIVATSWASEDGSVWLWLGGVGGAFVTALYAFRLVFVVFFGGEGTAVTRRPRWRSQLPLAVLGALSVAAGLVWLPAWMGDFHPLEDFLETALPETPLVHDAFAESAAAAGLAAVVVLGGIGIAALLWLRAPRSTARFAARPVPRAVAAFWRAGWGFDWLYERLFVLPVKWFARVARDDLIDPAVAAIAWLHVTAWRALSASQNGLLRLYLGVIGAGVALILAFVILR